MCLHHLRDLRIDADVSPDDVHMRSGTVVIYTAGLPSELQTLKVGVDRTLLLTNSAAIISSRTDREPA